MNTPNSIIAPKHNKCAFCDYLSGSKPFTFGPACLGIGIGHAFAGFPAIADVDRRSAAVVDIGFGELVVMRVFVQRLGRKLCGAGDGVGSPSEG